MKKSDVNDIDLIFRNHFEESEVPVTNRKALWNRINGSPNRYRVIPFLFLGFLISFISYAAYSSYFKNDIEVLYNKSSSEPELADFQSSQFPSKTLNINVEDNISPPNLNEVTNIDINKQENSPGETANQIEVNTGNSGLPISTKNDETEYSKYQSDITPSQNFYSDQTKTVRYDEHNLTQNGINNSIPAGLAEEEIENEKGSTTRVSKLEKLSFLDVGIQNIALEELPIKNTIKKCTTEGGGNLFVDVYTTAGIPVERITLNDAYADQTSHRDTWEERYRTLPSISAGISVGYETSQGLGLSIGAEYHRIESEYQRVQTITERVTVYDPMAYFYYDVNNEVVWTGDSVTAISSFDRTVSIGNSSNLIHIPLELSYELYNKAPWKVRASAAAIFNFSLNYRGHYLRPDQSLVQIDESNNDTYVSKNLGFGFEGGAYLGYGLSDNWELYFGPKFRFNNKSYWNDTEAINTSRHFISLRTGLRYHF